MLKNYSAGPITWDIKSQLQGRPAHEAIALLLAWANITSVVSAADYTTKLHVIQEREFQKAQPLPGVEKLLLDLKSAKTGRTGEKIHIALATSSHKHHFDIKTAHLDDLFSVFEPHLRVLGDDPRIPKGRGKPNPDIYLVALNAINESLGEGEKEIKPEECLVFEDGIPGVVAGRRAGMRVVWVPHAGLAAQYKGREEEVLAGRGEEAHTDVEQLGVVGDGRGEQLVTLERFPYGKYGIVVKD
ncbi:HAD-like protein [Venustampulla echinocandica]|uniref:HAD-like protein n=1 Tax=Venustampulla echinocandica TaxID=2656787 RepID=A0A370TUM8_9HELO|nr:HAD-like protein [Venustampulla echinocandica]RDL39231.1 HAD-like protein [Venustampulla echinocandica]